MVSAIALMASLPPPSYLLGEEVRVRSAIQAFVREDGQISQRLGSVLASGQRGGMSFEQQAGAIDEQVTSAYLQSFEQLAAARPSSSVPSQKLLLELQTYAALRTEAARTLAEGLRTHDTQKVQDALERSKQAAAQVQASKPAASSPSQ